MSFKLSAIPRSIRLSLWILLLSLTAVILLFPVHLQFEYHAVESLYIFGDNLLVFGVVFVIWMAALLLLLFSQISEWQRVVLIGIFALVFFGFWIIITPYGGWTDAMANMGHVKYLEQTGSIPFDNPVLTYFQYPGLHLTALSLSEISGLDIFLTCTLFLLFCRVLFAIILYVLFTKYLKNSRLASFSVLLMVIGNVLLQRPAFHPGITANIFFVILLYLLLTADAGRKLAMTIVFLICFTALTITYLPLTVFFIFVLSGVYVLQKLNGKITDNWRLLVLCLIIFLVWGIYWAIGFFTSMLGHIPDLVAAFNNPMERLFPIFGTASTSLGESTPLWASLTRYFWLVIIYVLGVILGIRNLFRFKRLDSIEILETGGLWGVLIFSVICVFAFPGGTQWQRVLEYAPFFTVPIIVMFIVGFSNEKAIHSKVFNKCLLKPLNWCERHAMAIISIVFLILSFPTFLVNNASISTMNVYKYELSAGEFVEANYDEKSLFFASDIITVFTNEYYVPDADLRNPPEPYFMSSEEEVWLAINELFSEFEGHSGPAVFVLTERFDQPYRSIISIEPSDPARIEFLSRISSKDMIYNNGHTLIYINQPAK